MIRIKNIVLTSTPELLTIEDSVETPNTISVQNTDSSKTIYIGDENVSSSYYGVKLFAGQTWSADLKAYDKIYAVGEGPVAIMILER